MRRWAIRICVFLILGAIVNVAVAWGCAVWVNAFEHGHGSQSWIADSNLPGRRHWSIMRRDAFGATRIAAMTNSSTPFATVDETTLFPYWSDLRSVMQDRLAVANLLPRPADTLNHPRPVALVDDARGWPFRALNCHWDFGMTAGTIAPSSGPLQRGFELPAFGGAGNANGIDYKRALPWRPIWPGFALNTVFYAFILWLLVAGPFVLRRWRRIRRGLCPKCAYPLGASDVCTECGAPLIGQASSHRTQASSLNRTA